MFSWVDKNDTPDVPKGAITGACSPAGKRIYVIRASHGTKLIAGNYEEGNEYAEYEQIGARQSNEWQYLVSNEEAFGMKIYTLLNNNNNGYYDHSSNHDPIITSKYQSNVFIKKHRLTGVWDLALQVATRGQSTCKLSKRLWYHNVPLPCYSSFADNDIRCNATAQVVTSDFFTQGIVIGRGASVDVNVIEQEQVNGRLFPITSDKNVSTCVNTTLGHDQLQAIFTFPALPPSDQLSVEVILMNVDDCSSPAWTWFVESECRPKDYIECSRTHITRVAEFTRCAINCVCLDSCDFLYLKYNRLPLRIQTSEQLCEIWSSRNGEN